MKTFSRKTIDLKDNLFLDRYAQSVTLNGQEINSENSAEEGFGVWRLTRADFEKVLNGKRMKSSSINSDYYNNVQLGCGDIDGFNQSTPIEEILAMIEFEPCMSAMALVTLLNIDGNYPVPIEFDAQESILYEISDQIVMEWEEVLLVEQQDIIDKCTLADIDFEFVIDASGSVGSDNWKLTMDQIAEYWIRGAIQPNGAKECGNHVAARRYSGSEDSLQVRWHDFEPPPPSQYPQYANYTEYVAAVFENEPFTSGNTYTAEALRRTRVYDIPTARSGKKYVMVFTDGASSDSGSLVSESKALQAVVDQVFAFGIGDGPNVEELKIIATNKDEDWGWAIMDDFSKYEFFIRTFMRQQEACETELVRPYRKGSSDRIELDLINILIFELFKRTIDVRTVHSFGLSQQTALDQNAGMCGMSCLAMPETARGADCAECSKSIAEQDLEEVNKYKDNIIAAANDKCFDAAILAAFISRQTRGGTELDGTDGWIPCHGNDPNIKCFGIMHMDESKSRESP